MKSMASFTGTRGEDAFCHVPVLVEVEGVPSVLMLFNVILVVEDVNPLFVMTDLNGAADTIDPCAHGSSPTQGVLGVRCQDLKLLDTCSLANPHARPLWSWAHH